MEKKRDNLHKCLQCYMRLSSAPGQHELEECLSAALELLLGQTAALCGQKLLLLLKEADHLWTPEQRLKDTDTLHSHL